MSTSTQTIHPDAQKAHTGKEGPWDQPGVLRGGRNGAPGKYDHLSFWELHAHNQLMGGSEAEARQEHTRRERLMKLEPLPFSSDEIKLLREEIDLKIRGLTGEKNTWNHAYALEINFWQEKGLTLFQARRMMSR
jgi:hypothetical protein